VEHFAIVSAKTRTKAPARDSVDRFLEAWNEDIPQLDPVVEGIVDRIYSLGKYLKRSMEETLAEFELNHGEWKVLAMLRRSGAPYRRSPGWLAERAGLSTGAMTNRLDRLEEAGLVRRLPDPDDRRALQVELTDDGHRIWEASTGAQAQKEALIASALDERQKEQLTKLLRRLMLVFEPAE
jgi:DNA-binding MarR family transcriptional regulator